MEESINGALLIIDSTYIGKSPNREKTVAHIKYWINSEKQKIVIYTTSKGIEFYRKLFSLEEAPYMSYLQIPFSSYLERTELGWVCIEFMKRMLAPFVVKIPDKLFIYDAL